MKQFVILIPSYKPDESLAQVVQSMKAVGFCHFVVVDDGGKDQYAPIFSALSAESGVKVLTHENNRGKGAALKTGFRYITESFDSSVTVLTVDGDGQHRATDVIKVADFSREHPNKIVLGSRDFSLKQVPWRSRFGNRVTSFIFRISGAKIRDTQTGLRAIPAAFLPQMIEIDGERYEYETNVLLRLKGLGIGVCEVEIETVYENDNSSSHFHPILDSLRIYGLIFRFWGHSLLRLLRFSASSLVCTAVDAGLFYVLHLLFAVFLGAFAEAVCQTVARAVSSVLNFLINRKFVFAKRDGKTRQLLLRYYALAIPQLIVSAALLTLLKNLFTVEFSHWVTLLKLCVDVVLFLVSYQIQRVWVFGKEKKRESKSE